MSKNPFLKYVEAAQRQDENYSYLRAGTPSLAAEYADIKLQPQYVNKTLNDYVGDTAVDATKAAMTLAQTGISALDLGAYSLGGLGSGAWGIAHAIAPETVDKPVWNEYGLVSKALNDNLGFNIGKAKQTLGELGYSDIRKAQEEELHTGYSKEEIEAFKNQWTNDFYLQYQDLANKGANALQLEAFKSQFEGNYKKAYAQFMDKYQTSWDKSLGENLDIIGHAFGKVMDNPSLGAGAAIESTGYLLPSLAVSRGVAALQGAAKAATATGRAVAAGTGEGLVSALALNEQMRGNSATGTIDSTKVAAGFAGGALTGLIGGVSNRIGSRFGLDDVDSLDLGTQAKGFSVTRPVLATGQEAGEEFLQGFGESIIPNIAEGKDPLQGLAQELALGTVAGGIMSGATNARSLVSGAGGDLVSGLKAVGNVITKGKDAITAKTFEELNDPANKAYDPAKAFNSQVPKINSQDDREREEALANMESVLTNLETHSGNLIREKVSAEGILKNIAALPTEEQGQHSKTKQQAEKLVKDLEARIIVADTQYMDLLEQKLTLTKNQEVQAGIPQYSEEQAKADIEVLSQAPVSTAVWATEDNDGNALSIPVTVTGTPVLSNGYETVEVKYTDSTGKERTTYAPTSELVQDTTTQQEAAQRITRHFSKLTLDELDTVAKSPYLSEEQRNSLRYLSEAKRAIADLASPTDVTDHIMNGLKGKTPMESHRGLNNYTEMVNTAINTKDEKLLNIALNDLGRFAQDHTDKANALVEANQLVTSGKFSKVQVLRSNDGTWGIVTDPNKFVDGIKLKATGSWEVHKGSNKNGKIDLVTKEATLIQDNLKALTQVGLSFGLQAVEPTVTTPVSTEDLGKTANSNKPASVSNEQSSNEVKNRDFTPENITSLKPNEIFVFGSNAEGIHGKGAALIAKQKFGAKQGQSKGLQGQSYAVVTKKDWRVAKSSTLQEIAEELQGMLLFAKENPSKKFLVTKLGSSLAGYTTNEVKGLFENLKDIIPDNVILPREYEVRGNQTKGTDDTSIKESNTKSDTKTGDLGKANKPVTTSTQSTADTTSAVARLNGFMSNKANAAITIDTITPDLLNQIEARVADAFDIGIVNQQTYDGVNEDINTLRQYLTTAATATPSQVSPVNVWAGSNENTKLSNLATRPFTFGGKKYQSVEHAYQTLKSGSFDQQTYDKYAGTENKKIAGNRGTKTTDNANVRLMEKLMTASFEQNKDAMELLQKTGDAVITHTQEKSIWGKEFPRILMEIRENNKTTSKPNQEVDTPTPKIGETSTEVKGRFTITKTVVSDNTVLSVHTNNDTGEVTKSEYATAYPDIYSDELGDKYTLVIYRDSTNPSVITDVKSFDPKDKKNSTGSYGKQGNQTDEKFITTFTEAGDVTLEYTDKFEKSLPVVKPKIPNASTQTEATEAVNGKATSAELSNYTNHSGGAIGSDTAWDKIGASYGMVNNKHYYTGEISDKNAPLGNTSLSQQDLEEGAVESAKAAKRNWGYAYSRMKDSRLIRNWAQVKYSDAIYAIGKIVKAGEAAFPKQIGDKRKAIAPSVTGGTGYAVGMAINHDKPVYVFNQEQGSYDIGWYKWDSSKNDFVKTDTPVLTKNFAGIGTREINAAGVQAIKDVYAKTQLDTTTPVEAESIIPETAEGMVKEYGYLGELLDDEDVEKVVKDVIEKVLEDKADKSERSRLTSYARFVGLFAVHGYIEYFTKQAKNDPNIIKLTKAANKLRKLVRLTQHINFLEDYVDSQNNDDLRAYLNKYPELKSIFSELKVKNPTKGTRSLALDVIADLTQVKNLITLELGKLVQLVGLMYIQAAFEKGQQYLRDTNYADLNEVLSPTVLTLLKGEGIGDLAKNKVLGDDAAFRRNSLTSTELTFLDKIDGIPVGELSKKDFETVKALVQNAVNAGFNSYKVVNYTRNEEKISSDIVHNIIVEHLPKEGFALENFTPEEVIKGAVPESFIWNFKKQAPTPSQDTTPPVEATTAEDTIGVSEAPNTKETQTSDDAGALIEALETEAKKRVTLADEDSLESEAQGYLEEIRLDIGSWGTVKAYVKDVTPEDLNTYKKLVFKLLKERNLSTKNASKIFGALARYVDSNQAEEAPVTQEVKENVSTPMRERVKGHKAHIETKDGKHIYEGTNGDTTYHYIWDEDHDEITLLKVTVLKNKDTDVVEDYTITIVDPETGKGIGQLPKGNKNLTDPTQIISSTIPGRMVQGYAQNPAEMTQSARDANVIDMTQKGLKNKIRLQTAAYEMAKTFAFSEEKIGKEKAELERLKGLEQAIQASKDALNKVTTTQDSSHVVDSIQQQSTVPDSNPVEAATAQPETKVESDETSSTDSTDGLTGEAANTGSQDSGDSNTGSIIENTTSTGQTSGETTTVTSQTEEGIIGTVEFTEDEQAEIDSLLKELDGLLGSNQPKDRFSIEASPIGELPIREEVTDAVAKARQAVRDLLVQLNFKFVDSPDVNLTDIERIASKYLISGTSNNDPTFLKEAAKALSYAIYFELDLKEGSTTSRAWLERSLLTWLKTGEIPRIHKGIWAKVVKLFYSIMAVFSGKEFENIDTRLEKTLNKIVNGGSFSLKPKEGYAPLVFQEEMDNNPLAVQSLLTLIKSGIKFALTGSIAYSDQVPVYRDKNKPLHDMDFVVSPTDLQAAHDYFTQADRENWGGSFTLYDVVKESKRILGFAVVPKGYIIKNGKSGWNAEENAPERSYDVYNEVTGLKEGSYYFLGGKKEVFTGVAGITIDLLADNDRDTITQTFIDTESNEHSIQVSTYVGGFAAKLGMMRYKDIVDFVNVIPPVNRVLSKPKEVTLKESNTQEKAFNKSTPLITTAKKFKDKAATLSDTELNAARNELEARRKNGDKSPILQMELKAYNDEVTNRLATKQPEDRFSLESKTLSLKEYVDNAVKNSEWLSKEDTARIQSAKTVDEVINILSSLKDAQTANKTQQKTLAQIKQEILAEVKAGNLTEEQSELLFFLAEKNPTLFDSLRRFDFVDTLGGSAAGKYSPVKKLVTIARDNRGSPTVLAHEMLHHMEVFLPASIKQGIVKAWRKALVKAIKTVQKGSNEALVLRALVEAQVTGDGKVLKEVLKSMGGLPNQSIYRLFSPSEFWAENASELLQDRMKENQDWTTTARNYLKEFYQNIKSIFGLDNNAAILQGLRLTLSGKTLRDTNVNIPVDFVADNKIIDLFSKVGKFNLSSIPEGFDSNQRFSLEAPNNLPNIAKVLAIGSKLGGILISKGVTEFERWSQDILALTTKYGISSSVMLPYLVPIYSKLIDEATPTTKKELTPLATITQHTPESIIEVVRKNSATRSIGFKPSTSEGIAEGTVTVLKGVTEEVREKERSQPFNLRNLIKAYFTQKKGDASNSPLVLVKDFISQLDFTDSSNLLTQLSKYLGNKTKVTDKHIAQLAHFKEFRDKLAPAIQRALDNEYHKNPKNNIVRDLLSINKLDENTITAIAVAAYGYLIRYGTSVVNTDDDIKAIVRLKKDSELPPDVAEYLRYVGQEAPYLEYELGEQVSKLLGLKVLKDSGVNLQGRLEKAFGNIVTMSLHDVGYIVIDTSVNPKVLGAMLEEADVVSYEHGKHNSLKFEDNAWEDVQEGQERLFDIGGNHAISNMDKMTFIRVNYAIDQTRNPNRNYKVIRQENYGSANQKDIVTVSIDYIIRKAAITKLNGETSYPLNDLVWGTDLTQETPNDAATIHKLSNGTGAFLGELFGTSIGYSAPQIFEPNGLLSNLKQATKTAVSKLQRKLIGEAQTLNVFTLRANTVKVLETLQGLDENSKYLKQLLGIWVDDDVLARTYIEDREGLQAKAANEWRMLENGLSWANGISRPDGTYEDFYDTQYIAQNERQHYSSNLFNMQTSLIHRAIGTIKGGVTIKFDSVNTDKNYHRFLQAVGEGLEGLDDALKDTIKSFTPKAVFYTTDKTDGEIYTYALEQYLAKPENLEAIEAMAAVIEGTKPNRLQRKAIAEFVKAGDMGIQSLQSLIALAEMQVAINQDKPSFITTVGLGSDGVNNGVATANLLTGVISRDMKQQVGMMPKEPTKTDPNPAKTMQEVYGKGLPDYYISFGLAMARALQSLRNGEPESDAGWRDQLQILFPIYKAIPDAFIEMRKIAKTWSVPFNYSAGIVSLQRALANGFMKGIIKEITSINNQALKLKNDYETVLSETESAKDKVLLTNEYNNEIETLKLKAETLEAHIRAVVGRETVLTDVYGKTVIIYETDQRTGWSEPRPVMVKRISFSFPSEKGTNSIDVFGLNNYKLPEAVVASLKQAVQSVHGVAAWDATQQYAFHYSQATSMLSTGNNASYTLYQNLRKALIEAKLSDKIDEKLAKYGGLKGFNDLNAQIAEENNQITAANRKLPKGVKWQPLKPSYDNRERNDAITEVKYLGLSAEELQEIDDILASIKPILHSPLSNKSGKITEGISLVETSTINLKPEENQQVLTRYQDKYSKPVTGLNNNAGLRDVAEEAAGIKALALAVQGMDAYVASHVQAKFPGINVHDAYIFAPDQFVEGTKYQNQIYLQGITEYHLGTAHAEAFVNSYLGLYAFSQAIDSLNLNQEYKDSLKNAIKEQMFIAVFGNVKRDKKGKVVFYVGKDGNKHIDYTGKFKGIFFPLQKKYNYAVFEDVVEQPKPIIEAYIKELIGQDLAKLEALKDMQAVHQYSGDGGAYVIGVGGDITEAEHLKNIEEQIKLVKLKEATLLKALENNNKTFELSRDNKDPKTELVKLLETNKGKPFSIQDVLTILKAVPASAKSSDAFEQQLAIIREIEPLLDGVSIVYADMVNDEAQGIDDYVQGAYDESSNTITIRANTKYPPTAKLVLHEILHSGLAARITYLESLPESDTQYAEARAALKQLDNLRKEILANLVEGVDASKYFELKAAFEKAGGWDAYKQVQQKLKEAKNSAYAARDISIKTLKELRLKAYEELNAQKAELQAAKNLEEEALDGLRANTFKSDAYNTARLNQQAALAAIKEIKRELRQKYENIANINTQLDKLYASNLADELSSTHIAHVALGREFLTLHSALKNTVFTINGIKEVTALDVVNWLVNNHEFISYGLTEESLQDIMQDKVQVKNTEKRKRTGLQGYWGAFVRIIGRILEIGKGETIDALSAFAMDVATFIQSVRKLNVPRAVVTESTLRKSTSSSQDQVNQMSSIEVMQSLPHTGNSDFGLHLNSLAESVIGQLYNNDEVAKAQIDVIQAIQAIPAIQAGFNLSQREAAVQRSLELVLETYIETNKGGLNVGQLWKIYEEAQKNIKVDSFYSGDWSKATPQERAATKQKFDYVMNSSNKGVESLARFISMGLATEEVHNLLGFNTISAKPSKQKTWFDTFNAWLRYVFAWVGGKLVKTSASDPAYKQLQKLVNNLTALDIRNRQDTIALYEKAWNLVGKATAPLDKAAQTLRQYATNRDFLRNSKYLPLRTLGSIAALDAKAMGENIPKLIRETRDKTRPNEKLGEAMNALMESTAMTQVRKAMEALIRQANLNAKKRQDESDNVKKAIMSWFKDGGKHITKGIHKAITYTLLRTDAQSLLTTFGLDKTIGLLLDTNKLKNEIDLVTKDISQYPNGVDMIHAAEDLGYYMISNKGGMGLNKNPTAIAAGIGTNYQIALEDVDQALVGQLDVLVSLYAMKYTSATDRKVLGEMYKENPEALEGLLNMHKGFMTDAATEFKNNPLNYVKGWMPEIVNPYREVRAASGTAERDQMIKEGWKLIEEIKPHGKFLMVHYDIGYQRLVSGAVDLQNSHRKGTEIIDRQSKQYLAAVRANLAYTAHRASIPLGQYDPTKKPTGLIPAYDTDGVPLGFNYEMASWVRDDKMERNNNFADLMGAYAGAMYYKPAKRNQSVTVANVLFEDYKQNYQKNPNSYIKLSGKSSDPKIVEMWRMLPKDFRQRATELYGKGEPIIINNEAFLLAFGFKKWSITNIWNKQPSERTHMETMFVHMAEGILGDTAKAKIAKAGHIWAEVVSKAKDFIVIRSIDVLWNNVLANGLMLMAHGINPVTIVKEWIFAIANVRAYQKLNSELIQLKANTLAGNGNSATEAQIKRIESQLEANPMSKYINEGLLSSIVEDVTIQQGDYTYDSELKKKIDSVTGWMPDSVKTLGAWAVFSPSTQGYQFLATTTQLSDFVAKVTLAKHLESKGMDFKAAVSEASQTFINYDVPQGVGMQYMNDMGLFMFTKFFLRIQAVLLKLMDKKAATVLAQHIATEGLTDMQGILDPMALTRVGNWPFEEGAFSIVGAAMSIAPVNAVF